MTREAGGMRTNLTLLWLASLCGPGGNRVATEADAAAETRMIVAVYVPKSVATRVGFESADGRTRADPHVTLTHVEHPTNGDEEATLRVVRALTSTRTPIHAILSGEGRFLASAADGNDIWYASVDSDRLCSFRQELVLRLEEAAVPVSRAHGFSPHITLAFLARGEPSPVGQGPNERIPIVFEAVAVKRAENDPTFLPFRG